MTFTGFTQPPNDACVNADRLCPGIVLSGTTAGATNEGTDNNVCYTSQNSVWYVFTTNDIGGSVTVSLSNFDFNPDPEFGQTLAALFFKTGGECGVPPYTPVSNCGAGMAAFDLNEVVALDPNTTYYVQISGVQDGATNAAECSFDIEISGTGIEVPDPTVTITTPITTVCQGADESVSTTITDCSDITNYEWIYNGSTVADGETNTFSTASLAEDGTLQLVISCGENCPKTDTSNLLMYEIIPVEAEAGEDTQIEQGEETTLTGSGIGNPTWTPSTSVSPVNSLTTTAFPTSTTTYFLTMENEGCFATDSVTVFVGDIITIFSGFSPNNDNVNDRWHILNSEKFPNMEVNVYSRHGQLVFSAVNYSSQEQWWDGTFKGKDLPVATYYYVVRLNDEDQTEYKGQVTILR